MVWKAEDDARTDTAKIKYLIVPYTRGRGLDVSGGTKAFAHFNVELQIGDLSAKDDSQDFVFSSHILDKVEDVRATLREWWRVIKPGGHLVLYLPHKLFYPNVDEKGAHYDHKHDFMPRDIEEAMMEVGVVSGWDFLENEERNEDDEYSFYQVFRKRDDGVFNHQWLSEKPKKSVCIVRYGGFGDMLQTCAVFPEFKRQGYHITMMCAPSGKDIIEHDPHVDAWLLQEKDQVPNEELGPYWTAWRKRFTRFVNFSESVEVTLLAVPGRTNYLWPDSMRRKYLGVNYAEFMADLAEVPFKPEAKFYATADEQNWAHDYLLEMRREEAKRKKLPILSPTPKLFSILWTLAGSSVHKFYPGQDTVVARILLEMPEAQIVFVGDAACALLEAGWENEPRIKRESGRMGIRKSLALAQIVDCVVGPETGVLNGVCYEPNRKVVLLSHSSRENLTKHWTNTATLEPTVPCYPCHRMHYDRRTCPEDYATGASVCAVSIKPEDVFAAIKAQYDQWRQKINAGMAHESTQAH